MLAIAGTGVFNLRNASRIVDHLAEEAERTIDILSVARDFSDMLRNVIVFADTGDDKLLDNIHNLSIDIRKEIKAIQDDAMSPEDKAAAQKMSALFEDYKVNLEKVVDWRRTREKLERPP
jgi:hypothetical protein